MIPPTSHHQHPSHQHPTKNKTTNIQFKKEEKEKKKEKNKDLTKDSDLASSKEAELSVLRVSLEVIQRFSRHRHGSP
jgi:hypothetical protein